MNIYGSDTPCIYFAQGSCRYGDSCLYSHVLDAGRTSGPQPISPVRSSRFTYVNPKLAEQYAAQRLSRSSGEEPKTPVAEDLQEESGEGDVLVRVSKQTLPFPVDKSKYKWIAPRLREGLLASGVSNSGEFGEPLQQEKQNFMAAGEISNEPIRTGSVDAAFSDAEGSGNDVEPCASGSRSASGVTPKAEGAHDESDSEDDIMDSDWYSKMEDISEEDRIQFESEDFDLDKLPLVPPPKELC